MIKSLKYYSKMDKCKYVSPELKVVEVEIEYSILIPGSFPYQPSAGGSEVVFGD